MKRIALGTIALTLALSACSGSDDADGDAAGTATSDPVAENAAEVSVGDEVVLPDGLSVTVTAMTVGGDTGGPWVSAEVVVENPTDVEGAVPTFGLVCAEGPAIGDYAAGSTVVIGDPLPAGETVTGTLNLLLPGDTRSGTQVPTCTAPAYVQAASVTTADLEATTGRVDVPAEVLAQLG
ncbi:MAG: hypothetical protein PIR53_05545 [Nocardioides alkalitolerans]